MEKSPITCHVLDSSIGKPARGVHIKLQRWRMISDEVDGVAFAFDPIAHGETNEDGRCIDLMTPTRASTQELAILRKGMYKIVFETKGYYELQNKECFYPWVEITFEVNDTTSHYHIPLLLSPYSYTTYRGS